MARFPRPADRQPNRRCRLFPEPAWIVAPQDERIHGLLAAAPTLEAVTPQLKYEEAPRPAQIRIRAADLSQARITPFVNNWGFSQTRDTSLGNIRLMHQVCQQFHIPGNAAKDTAEHLLDARLVDPLGGQYVYRQTPAGAASWTSTDLSLGREGLPEGYWAPPLNWFRGLDLDAVLDPDVLSAHAEIDMQTPGKTDSSSSGSAR